MACAIVGVSRDLNASFGAELVHHFLEHRALGIGQQMLAVAENKGVVGDAKTRVAARCKRGAADDHVYRTELQALVDVGLFAQARGWENLDVELAIAAFFDLVCGPDRLRVVGL